jgi:hypothetical protein
VKIWLNFRSANVCQSEPEGRPMLRSCVWRQRPRWHRQRVAWTLQKPRGPTCCISAMEHWVANKPVDYKAYGFHLQLFA